jgi:hypothetical protein
VFLAATFIAGNVVGNRKDGERAVTKKEALAVIQKLRSGKSSVAVEARRLGCYHATLRKALRAAIGSKQYDSFMDTRPGNHGDTGNRKRRRESAISTGPQPRSATANPPPAMDPFTRCPRCGDGLRHGTNGNGFTEVWCVCGWQEVIVPRRAAPDELVRAYRLP